MRLGVYSDLVYRRDGDVISAHQAFIRFITALPPRVDELVVFGRVHPEPARDEYVLPRERIRFVGLPHYPAVTSIGAQIRAVQGTVGVVRGELARLDAMWIFGPLPMAVALAIAVRRHGTPLFLGVRQDYRRYIQHRLPGPAWAWAVPVAQVLDQVFRMLARRSPTIVLGDELARRYSHANGANLLSTGFSLVQAADLVNAEEAKARSWDGELRLLSVGRLDAEKNPLLLAEIVARLVARDPRWHLVVAGDGPLRGALERRIADLGISGHMKLVGYVPSGPKLTALYRGCHAFIHVSLTEGVPQVLWEAQAAGIPVVATDVGGVRSAVGNADVILIPPRNPASAVTAIERLCDSPEDRMRLIEKGLANVAEQTMERQLDRIVAFFEEGREAGPRPARSGSVLSRPRFSMAGIGQSKIRSSPTGDTSARALERDEKGWVRGHALRSPMVSSQLRLGLVRFERGYRAGRLAWVLVRYLAGRPHEEDFRAFRRFPDRKGLFLDVGANIGQSALSFRLFNKAPILSLEPNPYHARELRLLRRLLPDFDFLMCGAGDTSGSLTLHVPTYRGTPLTGEASISREEAGRYWLKTHAGLEESPNLSIAEQIVEVRVLDDLNLAPDFVKIDVEGFELPVLRGLARTLERHSPVVLVERNDEFEKVYEFLRGLSYAPFSFDAPRDALEPYEGGSSTNVFFLPSPDRSRAASR